MAVWLSLSIMIMCANSVMLAGTFNDWKPEQMDKSDNGGFVYLLRVPSGRHEFKFVVDGNWVHDESQDFDKNEMGSFNNVINVIASPPPPSPTVKGSIEVERKFNVDGNFKEKFLQNSK